MNSKGHSTSYITKPKKTEIPRLCVCLISSILRVPWKMNFWIPFLSLV